MTPFQRAIYRASLVFIAAVAALGIARLLLTEPQPPGVRLVTEQGTAAAPQAIATGTPLAAPTRGVASLGEPRLININAASAAELEALPRIGEVLAQRIVDYRTANGPFTRPDHIMAVRGIGPATYEALRELITTAEP